MTDLNYWLLLLCGFLIGNAACMLLVFRMQDNIIASLQDEIRRLRKGDA